MLFLPLLGPARGQDPGACPPPLPTTPPTAEQVQQGMAQARDRGYLWRISKHGHVSYLYGTIHLAKREWVFPGPGIVRALREVDTVALEIDPQDPKVREVMPAALAASGPQADLPAELKERIARRVLAECLPPEVGRTLSPQAQVMLLTIVAARRDGLEFAYGIDGVLAGFARAASKRVVALETVQDQLRASQAVMGPGRAAGLEKALDELESGRTRANLVRLADLWSQQDLSGLQRWLDDVAKTGTDAERAMAAEVIDKRNRAMAASIDALHAAGHRVFAAVGSLHMVGPVGLPGLLSEIGYEVEPLSHP